MNQARDPVLFWNSGPPPSPTPPRDLPVRLPSPVARRSERRAQPPRAEFRVETPRIDHRQARRLVAQVPVLLRLCHDQCAFGIARNLSRDGAFIETLVRPDRNCCLDLMVPGLALADAAPALFPMMLIHRTERGLGLLFRSLDERTAAALDRLLREAHSVQLPHHARGRAN